MKAKGVSILLFFCLLAPPVLIATIIHQEKRVVRKSVKKRLIAGIAREELVLLKFSSRQKETLLNWEHSREFEYNGQMYDVVEAVQHGDTTSYWCWPDDAETELNRQLEGLMVQNWGQHPEKNKHQKRWLDFFNDLFHHTIGAYTFFGPVEKMTRPVHPAGIRIQAGNTPSPPPRTA